MTSKSGAKLFFILSIITISCGKKEEDKTPATTALNTERELFFNSILDPSEVTSYLKKTSIPFQEELLHNHEDWIKYANNESKAAANLGVYLADLNYCIIHQQRDLVKKYFNVTFNLSQSMGVEKNTIQYLANRYENNINQNDSTRAYFNQVYSQATTSLKDTDREVLIGITIAGYQIENFYQLLSSLENVQSASGEKANSDLAPLLKTIVNHRHHISSILNFVKIAGNKNNPDYFFFLSSYRNLLISLDALNADEATDDTLIQSLDSTKINDLLSEVKLIRERIISFE